MVTWEKFKPASGKLNRVIFNQAMFSSRVECVSGASFHPCVCDDQVPLSNWIVDLREAAWGWGCGGGEGSGAWRRGLPSVDS